MTITDLVRLFTTVALAAASMLLLAAPARAGNYTVRQCDAAAGAPAAEDARSGAPFSAYTVKDACLGGDTALKVGNVEPANADHYGLWRFVAPQGTALRAVQVGARLASDRGHHPAVYLAGAGGGVGERLSTGDTAGWDTLDWSAPARDELTTLVSRLRCAAAAGEVCPEAADARAWIRDVRLTLADAEPPSLALAGDLLAGGWLAGASSLSVGAADQGGGVRRIEVAVNGTTVAGRTLGCDTIAGSQSVSRLRPCPADAEAGFSLDTAQAPFREGPNDLLVCVEDYGADGANRTCAARGLSVDNEPPGPPGALAVEGGSDWRRVNEFDLGWVNPPQPFGAAPIAAAHHVLESGDGAPVAGPALVSGAGIERLEGVAVPGPGSYRLRVWLEDEAGNASAGQSAAAWLRFDDVAPGAPVLEEPPGWLGLDDLERPYVQRWSEPAVVPVSGIAGYAVAADRLAGTNPCETAGDPAPDVCADSELTGDAAQHSIALADLPEGSTHVHAAAASGSGVRSASVAHVELRVDRGDPEVELTGAPAGWTDEAVTLVARASDELSGMLPEAGDDGAPLTALQVDEQPALSEPDGELGLVLEADGDHLVRYWARDLAGNESAVRSARVRIDRSPPSVAFRDAGDPADRELIRAPVTDELSGAARGTISYHGPDDAAWQPLATELREGELRARLPSDQLADGLYELRVEVADRAGNEAATLLREDGSVMQLELPLKAATRLRAGLGAGSRRLEVAYGRAATMSGRLLDWAGAPLAAEPLTLVETFADGSLEATRSRVLVSGDDGRFDARLAAGPSREVTVEYGGSRRQAPATGPRLRLRVAGRATIAVSDTRPRVGERLVFRGRVGHRGAIVPDGGKLVELQVARPEGWDTVGQAFPTEPDGAWAFRYRFGDYYLEPTRFRFRLKVAREGGWPYRPVTTRAERLTVVPRR